MQNSIGKQRISKRFTTNGAWVFFGSLEYDEDYFESVADVLHEFEKILSDTDFDTHEIIMWCWW